MHDEERRKNSIFSLTIVWTLRVASKSQGVVFFKRITKYFCLYMLCIALLLLLWSPPIPYVEDAILNPTDPYIGSTCTAVLPDATQNTQVYTVTMHTRSAELGSADVTFRLS